MSTFLLELRQSLRLTLNTSGLGICDKGIPTQGPMNYLSISYLYCDWPCVAGDWELMFIEYEWPNEGLFGYVRVLSSSLCL